MINAFINIRTLPNYLINNETILFGTVSSVKILQLTFKVDVFNRGVTVTYLLWQFRKR